MLDALRGNLIVSVQAAAGSAQDDPSAIASMAAAALASGAVAVRLEGAARIAAVRARVDAPIIGIIKRKRPGFEPYITATLEDAALALDFGASIVAIDATGRARPDGSAFDSAVRAVHLRGALAMADCATLGDAQTAIDAGADIIATTLAGYTEATGGRSLPALDLVREMRSLGTFVVCEGGIASPTDVAEAFAAGADAIVVGTALTNLDVLVARFSAGTRSASQRLNA